MEAILAASMARLNQSIEHMKQIAERSKSVDVTLARIARIQASWEPREQVVKEGMERCQSSTALADVQAMVSPIERDDPSRDVSSVLRSLHASPASARHCAFPRFLPASTRLFPRFLPDAGVYKRPSRLNGSHHSRWHPFFPPQAQPSSLHRRLLHHQCAMMNRPGDGQFPPPSSSPPPPPPTDSQFDINAAAREERPRRGAPLWRGSRQQQREALEQQARQQREAAHAAAFYALTPQLTSTRRQQRGRRRHWRTPLRVRRLHGRRGAAAPDGGDGPAVG
ncbi:hypothetical protein QYE76_001826 [Lolium multiflorum]|uniref:Uncharacterized protein n=1 Tax=Lolium multiflorum TaxID=4521 RepID=A0AAD8W019_LOLMU|nr:hypothetical protein QYE76_001826 [Lolium multiflorum]